MNDIFADTSYFVALIFPNDDRYQRTLALTARHTGQMITTTWVVVKVGNFCSSPFNRHLFISLIDRLRKNRMARIIDVDQMQFDAGLNLYSNRPDKAWSLTDCISFNVMRELNLQQAWTTDHHFEQAGFQALLK